MLDITLTLPCPLCPNPGRMLTAIYEPQAPSETPLLAEVSGCEHAEVIMAEMAGTSSSGLKSSPRGSTALWKALQHEAEMYCLDLYTERLAQSAKYRHLREED